MKTLRGLKINLRALEPTDLGFLYNVENNEAFWTISHTQTPFSKYLLKRYLENAHLDIYSTKQLRLIIEDATSEIQMGMIDLFDFNPKHKRVGLGILIAPQYQNKGFASECLQLIVKYGFNHLDLHQFYANILDHNAKSIALFEKFGFQKVGVKKDWIFANDTFHDEILYQFRKK